MKALHIFLFTLILAGVLSVSWSTDCEGVPCDVVCEIGGKELFPDCACDCPGKEKRSMKSLVEAAKKVSIKAAKEALKILGKVAPEAMQKLLEKQIED
ncbi:hypothetical protein TNCT_118421 [Trichonephila clavata]|uniref:Uncharacterized protein n=1 Tax=Trichonephila clavata TaxID=2740835 RepID=A0A8X6FI60_TRICU|nr:hypothetical protein TNCT_118421 [Trichonephila clavata]